jgi:PAT family beta-lactamase induction signal transducer AmpG
VHVAAETTQASPLTDFTPAPRNELGSEGRPPAVAGAAPLAEGSAGAHEARPRAKGPAPWVISTYFGEGLPWSIVHQVSAEMFTALGASLQAIGYTALYGLTWNGKGLWSPVIDMYSTTRRWLIGIELALVLAIGVVAWPAGAGDLRSVAIALTVVAFLGATQDIAVDGFYMRALAKDQQASLSGLRVGAYRVALLVGKGLLVALAGLTSWRTCFLAAAGVMLALAAFHAAVLPREPRRQAAAQGEERPSFTRAFSSFFTQPKIAWTLAFILVFRAGDALMFAMSPPLLRSLGLDTTARAVLSGMVGTGVSIAGSVVGGVIIGRYGLARTLRPITLIQSFALLLYVWLAWAKPALPGIAAIVVLEQFAAGVGTAVLLVFLMRRARGEYKTSHFAIGSSLMSLATTLLGTVSGHIAQAVGFTGFFALAFAASLPGVALSFKVPTE